MEEAKTRGIFGKQGLHRRFILVIWAGHIPVRARQETCSWVCLSEIPHPD